MLADAFEKFLNKFIETRKLDPAHFLSAPEFSMSNNFKKAKVKLQSLTDTDMLLLVEIIIRGGIFLSLLTRRRKQ